MKRKFKNPNVTFKDLRKGKILFTGNMFNENLIKIKLLEDFKISDKKYIQVQLLSDVEKVYTHLSDETLVNPKAKNGSYIMFPRDQLCTPILLSLYFTPSAAKNARKKFYS